MKCTVSEMIKYCSYDDQIVIYDKPGINILCRGNRFSDDIIREKHNRYKVDYTIQKIDGVRYVVAHRI